MKILVTGHKGFIGTYLAAELRAQGHTVVGCDLRDPNHDTDINTMHLNWFDKVFHLAAKVDARADNATEMAETNIIGSLRLFERYGEKVVFASSCAVHYPTPYGLTKKAAEEFARLFGCGVVRLCNIYGFGGHSVVDIFRRSSTLRIAGDGAQLRTYAPVEKAVQAFMECHPGELSILQGEEWTVTQIADRFPEKPRVRVERGKYDITVGVQVPS